jgi:hypothetical protein
MTTGVNADDRDDSLRSDRSALLSQKIFLNLGGLEKKQEVKMERAGRATIEGSEPDWHQ